MSFLLQIGISPEFHIRLVQIIDRELYESVDTFNGGAAVVISLFYIRLLLAPLLQNLRPGLLRHLLRLRSHPAVGRRRVGWCQCHVPDHLGPRQRILGRAARRGVDADIAGNCIIDPVRSSLIGEGSIGNINANTGGKMCLFVLLQLRVEGFQFPDFKQRGIAQLGGLRQGSDPDRRRASCHLHCHLGGARY